MIKNKNATLAYLLNTVLELLTRAIRQEDEMKDIRIGNVYLILS